MARTSVLTTRVLLTTAAIGVATGLLAGIAGWVTPLVLVTAPILYGFVLGAHVLPGIIAQEVIRLPWVALLTHVFAALVASAMAPQWALRFLGTAILFVGAGFAVLVTMFSNIVNGVIDQRTGDLLQL